MATDRPLWLKPAQPDLKVRDPITKQFLKDGGEKKPRSSYWIRRLAAGEVVEIAEPKKSVEAKEAPAKVAGKLNHKGGE